MRDANKLLEDENEQSVSRGEKFEHLSSWRGDTMQKAS